MAYQPQEIFFRSSAPVTIDEDKCIAEKGCTVCVEVCPMDLLAINPATQKAYMAFDECWYCMPCEKDCPTGAVKVDIPCVSTTRKSSAPWITSMGVFHFPTWSIGLCFA